MYLVVADAGGVQRAHAVDHGEAVGELTVGDVVLDHLVDPVNRDRNLRVVLLRLHQLVLELLEDLEELLSELGRSR